MPRRFNLSGRRGRRRTKTAASIALVLFFALVALLRPYIPALRDIDLGSGRRSPSPPASGAPAPADQPVFSTPDTGAESITASVKYVIDGDTIVLTNGRHVRYTGIDTPELNSSSPAEKTLAQQAKALNERLVGGQTVRLELDRDKTDKYGRLLAYVWVGDRFINGELVASGLARAKDYGSKLRRWNELTALEAQARQKRLGIWATRQ